MKIFEYHVHDSFILIEVVISMEIINLIRLR
jgi:hypothetical protein